MDNTKMLSEYVTMIQKLYTSVSSLIDYKEVDKLSLGTGTMYLNSIYEHIDASLLLLDKGFIESAGAVICTLWERSITLQYILTDSKQLSKVHSEHNKIKETPWRIKTMLKQLIDKENLPEDADKELHVELYYFEYTYLCVIKHGNPLTLSYLQRLDKNQEAKPIIGFRPNNSNVDVDLKNLLLLRVICSAFDALNSFSRAFCIEESFVALSVIDKQLTKLSSAVDLKVPPIIYPEREELSERFWLFLEKLK